MAISANDEDVEMEIPPQQIQEFDLITESEDFFDTEQSEAEPDTEESRL